MFRVFTHKRYVLVPSIPPVAPMEAYQALFFGSGGFVQLIDIEINLSQLSPRKKEKRKKGKNCNNWNFSNFVE